MKTIKQCFCGKFPDALIPIEVVEKAFSSPFIIYLIYGSCCDTWSVLYRPSNIDLFRKLSSTERMSIFESVWNNASRHKSLSFKKDFFSMDSVITKGKKYKGKSIRYILEVEQDYKYIFWIKSFFKNAHITKEVLELSKSLKKFFEG